MPKFSLCDALERESGHMALSLLVAVLGVVAWRFGFPHADAVVAGALGWLGRSMGSTDKS
jgi:hypothetical protein